MNDTSPKRQRELLSYMETIRSDVEIWNNKSYRDDAGEDLHELGVGKDFLSRIQKTLIMKENIDKSHYIKTCW